eukprot:6835335-Prymnesium_polylepis.1
MREKRQVGPRCKGLKSTHVIFPFWDSKFTTQTVYRSSRNSIETTCSYSSKRRQRHTTYTMGSQIS